MSVHKTSALLALAVVCTLSSCLGPTFHVHGRGADVNAGRGKGMSFRRGENLYLYLIADRGGSLFNRDTDSRTVALLRIKAGGREAVCPGNLEGFVFRHGLRVSYAGEVTSGTVAYSVDQNQIKISGEVVVRSTYDPYRLDAGDPADGLVRVVWEGIRVKPEPNLPSMLLSPRFVKVAPRLEEWRQDLKGAGE